MGDTIDEKSLNKIADFIQKYAPQYTDRDKLKKYILKHYEFKTAFVGFDNKDEVTFVCRWNVEGDTATMLDFYIREDYRRQDLFPQLLKKGLWIFPQVKFLRYERFVKYPNKGFVVIPIERFIKERN